MILGVCAMIEEWGMFLNNSQKITNFPCLNIVSTQTRSSADYYWQGKGRDDRQHCIIQYTLSGCGFFERDGERIGVPIGRGFICHSHDERTGYGYPADEKEPWRFLFIDFSGGEALVEEIIERFGHVFSFNPDSETFRRLGSLRFRKETSMSFTESTSLMTAALANIVETEEGIQAESRHNRITLKAFEIVNSNLQAGINVKALAKLLKISPEHFSRLFKKDAGRSPIDYIRKERMKYAAKILKNSQQSVKEIAVRMGYETSANFARSFKRVYGENPAKFRAL